ncbi:hypothetical protein [uncultured Ruminococcus sp.]|uniref:hypothetical protein n=1 Tax=uncultured Ruminococcus sp. TaxID=165186 RepID=UPI0026161258|nr:hypothetical protein [uncultured Ruminococcus sp.]
MQKPNALRITLFIAALCCATKLAIDLFFITNNHLSFFHITADSREAVIPAKIKMFLIIASVLSTVPIGIIAGVNYVKTDMSAKRSRNTFIAAGVSYLVYLLGFILVRGVLYSVAGNYYGSDILAMFSSLNSMLSLTDFLIHASAVMVFSCAAVEHFGGSRKKELDKSA